MGAYLARRTFQTVLVVLAVSFITYGSLFLASDPAVVLAGPEATRADIELTRRRLGLDQPFLVQYGRWIAHLLIGDFGTSFRTQRPVLATIAERVPATASLATVAFLSATLTAIPIGAFAAAHPKLWINRLATLIAAVGQAIPMFWLGIMLAVLFGVRLAWLPVTGSGTVFHMVLPVITLATYLLPLTVRLTRSSMLEILSADYIRTARGKGLSSVAVMGKHALRPALIPVVGVLAIQLGGLLGGTVVIETVFAWPGVGTLAISSIIVGDFPVVQGIVLLMALIFALVNLTADIGIALLDPRIRLA